MLTLYDSFAAHNFQVFGFTQSGLRVPITLLCLSFPSLLWRQLIYFFILWPVIIVHPFSSSSMCVFVFDLHVVCTSVCLQRLSPILELIWREAFLALNWTEADESLNRKQKKQIKREKTKKNKESGFIFFYPCNFLFLHFHSQPIPKGPDSFCLSKMLLF